MYTSSFFVALIISLVSAVVAKMAEVPRALPPPANRCGIPGVTDAK
jgi:hypothetical protein